MNDFIWKWLLSHIDIVQGKGFPVFIHREGSMPTSDIIVLLLLFVVYFMIDDSTDESGS
mgnify:CR=1